jgi:hypothetical protein
VPRIAKPLAPLDLNVHLVKPAEFAGLRELLRSGRRLSMRDFHERLR